MNYKQNKHTIIVSDTALDLICYGLEELGLRSQHADEEQRTRALNLAQRLYSRMRDDIPTLDEEE